MKKILALIVSAAFSVGMTAQENKMKESAMLTRDHVMMKDGKMMVVRDGRMIMMYDDMKMSDGSIISANGTVKLKNGKTMSMRNGDMIDMDGRLIKSKIQDHVMMQDGKMVMMKNGRIKDVDKEIFLSDGSIITPSGMIRTKEGKTIQMKNGDMRYMNGATKNRKAEKSMYATQITN